MERGNNLKMFTLSSSNERKCRVISILIFVVEKGKNLQSSGIVILQRRGFKKLLSVCNKELQFI